MQALKVIGFGLLFSFFGTIVYLVLGALISILRGPVSGDHATGLGAVVIGLKDATVFNPIYWLVITFAFGAAFWTVRLSQKT
jgi:hypothetical protein